MGPSAASWVQLGRNRLVRRLLIDHSPFLLDAEVADLWFLWIWDLRGTSGTGWLAILLRLHRCVI